MLELNYIIIVVVYVLVVLVIYIKSGAGHVAALSDKEEDFIDRAVNPRIESRLGCQCILAKGGTGELEIILPDQTQFLGE
jgi:2Fe-2S ferredoxin